MSTAGVIPCYFLEPTDDVYLSLRRYTSGGGDNAKPCPARDQWGHDAHIQIGESHRDADGLVATTGDHHPHDDPRWPQTCDACDYRFTDEDAWQLFQSRKWHVVRSQEGAPDVGSFFALTRIGGTPAPPGAMWYADWWPAERNKGPDGRTLMCRTPGGDWMVDGVASNCTKPDDVDHRCWVRHGEPPNVTVDKNGNTCDAGAGSIGQRDYHGFLKEGHLVP